MPFAAWQPLTPRIIRVIGGGESRPDRPQRGAAMTTEAPTPAAIPTLRMLIGGEQIAAADGQTFDVVSPVTGDVIARVAKGDEEDVDRAVAAAQRAFDGEWHTWSQTRRGQALARLAQLTRDHAEELAQLESRSMGKPISSARWEIGAVANVIEYYGGAANKLIERKSRRL